MVYAEMIGFNTLARLFICLSPGQLRSDSDDWYRTISCLSRRGKCGKTYSARSDSLQRQSECFHSIPAKIKDLEKPYVFAQLDQFQESLCAEARKLALEKGWQGINIDRFCDAVRAVVSNEFKPLIDSYFHLEGWIKVNFESDG